MDELTKELLKVGRHHDDLRARLIVAQEQTLMIAVKHAELFADHGVYMKKLYLEKQDTFEYLQEVAEDISLEDIHHLIH